ncbi:hypothetical protein QTP70_030287 [Hemibagrus guttatus]|uniref:Reverse transcriptase RNase H-like domain-containing protein n=1 Tax=Hemibagrus guttatus TaxID=175788 RepID=A0AAE0Q016_9TELE|nr:hypothetical protein QTP70_030287 [Hemibagrus guttatus]
MGPLMKEHMEAAQHDQQQVYKWPAQPREFQPGNQVMLLVSNTVCKFLAKWQGLYMVHESMRPGRGFPVPGVKWGGAPGPLAVLYMTRKLTSVKKNYVVVEQESHAIKLAIKDLRYYLAGWHFTLVTKHAPLMWMAKSKDTNVWVTQWVFSLQDFSFQVQHRDT